MMTDMETMYRRLWVRTCTKQFISWYRNVLSWSDMLLSPKGVGEGKWRKMFWITCLQTHLPPSQLWAAACHPIFELIMEKMVEMLESCNDLVQHICRNLLSQDRPPFSLCLTICLELSGFFFKKCTITIGKFCLAILVELIESKNIDLDIIGAIWPVFAFVPFILVGSVRPWHRIYQFMVVGCIFQFMVVGWHLQPLHEVWFSKENRGILPKSSHSHLQQVFISMFLSLSTKHSWWYCTDFVSLL